MDYSKLSDEELLQEYQSKQLAQRAMAAGGSDNYLNDVTGRTSPDYSKMSDEELLRMAGMSKPPPVVTPQPKTGPMVSGDDLTRVAGRTGRTLASGAATLADIPGMLLKAGGDLGYDTGRKAVNVFSPDLASYMPPRRTETIPLPSEGVRRTIDQLTGNRFAPQNRLEKAVDTAGEFMAGLGGGSLLNKAAGLTTEAVRKAPASLDTIVNSMQARKTADLTAAAGAGIGQEYGGLPGAIAGAYIGGKVGSVPDSIENAMTRKPAPTADQIKPLANAAYKQAEDLGGALSPKITNKFADAIDDMAIQTEEGKIFSGGESLASKVAERMKQMRDKPISLRGAQEMDEYMGDLIDAETGLKGMSKQGQKIYEMQTKFRELIKSAGEGDIVGGKEGFQALEKGRELWSKQIKMRDVERIIERAKLTDNPATAIRTGFKNLLTSNRIKGYSPEEKDAIRAASKSGIIGGALRFGGSRIMSAMAGTAAGAAGGGPVGAVAGMAGGGIASYPLREASTALQLNRANEVARLIAGQNSPTRQPSTFGLLTTDAAKQIKSAPRDLGRGLLSIMRDQSSGSGVPSSVIRQVESLPPAPPKLLPAPDKEIFVNMRGVAQPKYAAEVPGLLSSRNTSAELGMTPDVFRAAKARQMKEISDILQAEFDRAMSQRNIQKANEIEGLWRNNQKQIEDIITESFSKTQDMAKIMGNSPSDFAKKLLDSIKR